MFFKYFAGKNQPTTCFIRKWNIGRKWVKIDFLKRYSFEQGFKIKFNYFRWEKKDI